MIQNLTKVMKAVRDPNRVKILKILQFGELCASEIQAILGLSQSCTSKHLEILVTAGLLKRRKKGLWSYFSLTDEPGSPYASYLLDNLRKWLDDDPQIVELVAKIPEVKQRDLCKGEGDSGLSSNK